MRINGLDDIDNTLLTLLKENARYTYSELAEYVGISRVAVKNRIQDMEEIGLIRGYEVKIAPKKVDTSVEFMVNVSPRPEHYDYVVKVLAKSDMILKVQASSGDCKIIAIGVAGDMQAMDVFYRKLRTIFTDVREFSFDVITSTYKDVDGGIDYERREEISITDARGFDSRHE
ncbi:MAG: Lrp/AsnC family transcriptional regulator [Lachnospiraceae bacterium]|nr:Lrp/AsnC family transcriptional regulator [Lachnospiraceae bacterium]